MTLRPIDFRSIPRLDEPATIGGFTLLLAVFCSCGAKEPIGLMNAQKAVCEGCGRVFHANSLSWDKTRGLSDVDITARCPGKRRLRSHEPRDEDALCGPDSTGEGNHRRM